MREKWGRLSGVVKMILRGLEEEIWRVEMRIEGGEIKGKTEGNLGLREDGLKQEKVAKIKESGRKKKRG